MDKKGKCLNVLVEKIEEWKESSHSKMEIIIENIEGFTLEELQCFCKKFNVYVFSFNNDEIIIRGNRKRRTIFKPIFEPVMVNYAGKNLPSATNFEIEELCEWEYLLE